MLYLLQAAQENPVFISKGHSRKECKVWGKTNALKIKNLKDSATDWEEAIPEERL